MVLRNYVCLVLDVHKSPTLQYGMSSSKPNKDNIRLDKEVKQNSSSQGCLKLSVSGSKKIFALIQHLLNVYQGEYDLLTCLMRARAIATKAIWPCAVTIITLRYTTCPWSCR